MSAMLVTNETKITNFRNAFENNLVGCNSIKIASGYIGASEIVNYKSKLCDISNSGGLVHIIHGMGGVEGLRKNLYKKLIELDADLKKTNKKNGVFVHRTHYHGKMYITGTETSSKVLIGSSNFSMSGFGRNLELNYCHSDVETNTQASLLFDRLKSNSFLINKIKLPNRTKQEIKQKKYGNFNPSIFNTPPDKSIEIRVTEASNLNLFLSKGRLNRATGVYTPRPFNEIELTIGSKDIKDLRKYLPDQLEPAEFDAVTDIGTTFKVKFKRKTSGKYDMRTLHHTGIDFMSTGREDGGRKLLGQYMKGKLMQNGLLNFGDPVTDDVLIEYGKFHLDLYFIGNGVVYLKF